MTTAAVAGATVKTATVAGTAVNTVTVAGAAVNTSTKAGTGEVGGAGWVAGAKVQAANAAVSAAPIHVARPERHPVVIDARF